jgi:hypothetical protein
VEKLGKDGRKERKREKGERRLELTWEKEQTFAFEIDI